MADEVEISCNANSQEEMEAPSNPAYRQYLADRADEERKEATMPTSMMAHCILPTNEQQQQMLLYQQLGMVQQQHQHQQLEQQHQLVQQLGEMHFSPDSQTLFQYCLPFTLSSLI